MSEKDFTHDTFTVGEQAYYTEADGLEIRVEVIADSSTNSLVQYRLRIVEVFDMGSERASAGYEFDYMSRRKKSRMDHKTNVAKLTRERAKSRRGKNQTKKRGGFFSEAIFA